MIPDLKVSQLTNLHDARYCSAVGIFLQAFTLERGHPKKVAVETLKEIIPWLSGPKIIGEYGYEGPVDINTENEVLNLDFVSVPVDYPTELASLINAKLVFRTGTPLSVDSQDLRDALDKARLFPDAVLELELPDLDPNLWEALSAAGIIERTLLKFPNPDQIWILLKKQGIQPLGFSLGAYVVEADGQLDYEVCDEIVERFNGLVG